MEQSESVAVAPVELRIVWDIGGEKKGGALISRITQ